ncbi:MAG TPA: VOC family protein [Micromonosporaceae bacterium]
MPESITPRQFHEADGVEDWRALATGVSAYFRTGSFAAGVELVEAIGTIAGAADRHPDIDLRSTGVTVTLVPDENDGLTDLDVDLARRISAAARELGVPADPSAVQDVQLTVDALVCAEVRPFWRAVLGYREKGDEDLLDPRRHGPPLWFQDLDAPRPQRNRIHVDVWVPHDQAEARVAAAIAAGGRLVTDEHAPAWWVLADAEGNEVCLATWMGRD